MKTLAFISCLLLSNLLHSQIADYFEGNPKPDSKLRDYERVPLNQDVELYFEKEVKPHLPESWIDFDRSKVGYEINFNKHFYQYSPLRSSYEILKEIEEIESQIKLNLTQLK